MPTTVTYFVSPTSEAVAEAAAALFTTEAIAAVKARGVARIAISGGSTPKRMLAILADPMKPFAAGTPWDKLELFWVDERCVPPTDSDSNFKMTKEASARPRPASGRAASIAWRASSTRMRPQLAMNPTSATPSNSKELRHRPSILILLGMGDDGHTASLFPHTDALNEISPHRYPRTTFRRRTPGASP